MNLRYLLALASGAATPGAATLAMNAEPVITFDLPVVPGITVIDAASGEYSQAIQSLVDPAVFPEIQPLLQYCFVLQNHSGMAIPLY